MRLERLTYNKIKIFLTFDDLTDRGLTKEDIWKDSLKWQQLFHDMLEEASNEFGFEIHGSVAVEVFSLHAQGMVMIVTMEEQDEDEESLGDGFIEMQVTAVDGNEDVLFEFENIEDIIQLAIRLFSMNIFGGNLYSLNGRYFLLMNDISSADLNKTISILAEYGSPSIVSIHRLLEYGKEIIRKKAVETLVHYFSK
ncbi:genetic competence negative regulator [Bacillus methanolicus]|uniref:Adapter protein MecA n=1 Tax=Bacillus methanolicus (strain MGA3 / ATCC 53907) TaxID=796606 RepID=I3EA12_BACMM|nr:genetic competence negative regulator [Bacillus methanolicus]AIE60576.1 Adapter protein MecA 2 [Bacillus methanolicus MGA3]EIJ83333.1 adaptor protein [Bacillus methanolicus MGA3]UQD52584.1 genetic competence negative regulator [Bacillus methanolicus]